MNGSALHSSKLTSILSLGTWVVFLVSEALVVITYIRAPKNTLLTLGFFAANIFITAIPAVAGMRGYYAAKRLSSSLGEEITTLWFSRQFLLVAAFAYAALITNAIFLTEALRLK